MIPVLYCSLLYKARKVKPWKDGSIVQKSDQITLKDDHGNTLDSLFSKISFREGQELVFSLHICEVGALAVAHIPSSKAKQARPAHRRLTVKLKPKPRIDESSDAACIKMNVPLLSTVGLQHLPKNVPKFDFQPPGSSGSKSTKRWKAIEIEPIDFLPESIPGLIDNPDLFDFQLSKGTKPEKKWQSLEIKVTSSSNKTEIIIPKVPLRNDAELLSLFSIAEENSNQSKTPIEVFLDENSLPTAESPLDHDNLISKRKKYPVNDESFSEIRNESSGSSYSKMLHVNIEPTIKKSQPGTLDGKFKGLYFPPQQGTSILRIRL